MKLILTLLLASAFSVQAVTSERQKEVFRKVNAREGSFRRVLLSHLGKSMIAELSLKRPSCGGAVRKVYADGGTFYSEMVDQAARPLDSFHFYSGVQDTSFFHFTVNKAFQESFNDTHANLTKNRKYEEIFTFLRTKTSKNSLWSRVFYLAEEASSISDWAPHEIEFQVNLKARTVQLTSEFQTKALEEMSKKYPQIKKECGTDLDLSVYDRHGQVAYNNLIYLIAEDSGIEMFEYLQGGRWFQILSSDIFLGAKANGDSGGRNRNAFPVDAMKAPPSMSYLYVPVIQIVKAELDRRDLTESVGKTTDGNDEISYTFDEKLFNKYALETKHASITYECLVGGENFSPARKMKSVEADLRYRQPVILSCKN